MGEAKRRKEYAQRMGYDAEKMARNGIKLAMLVVYRAREPEGPWDPIRREDVPSWIGEDVMGYLKNGHLARNDNAPEYWYRAEEVTAPESVILQ